jgi:hypothetical protein
MNADHHWGGPGELCLDQNALSAQLTGHVCKLLHGHRQDIGASHYTETKLLIGENMNNTSMYGESPPVRLALDWAI